MSWLFSDSQGTAVPGFLSPDPVLTATDPSDLDPYDYAYGNPVTNEDPSGDRPTGANNCGSDDYYCSSVSPDQPSLNLTDVAEGALDGLYETGVGILAMGAYSQGDVEFAKAIGNLPLPFANSDPDNPSFNLGRGGVFVASLLVPGGEEADAATLTTDALTDTARTAAAGGQGYRSRRSGRPGWRLGRGQCQLCPEDVQFDVQGRLTGWAVDQRRCR